jgi:hypothetical protein
MPKEATKETTKEKPKETPPKETPKKKGLGDFDFDEIKRYIDTKNILIDGMKQPYMGKVMMAKQQTPSIMQVMSKAFTQKDMDDAKKYLKTKWLDKWGIS